MSCIHLLEQQVAVRDRELRAQLAEDDEQLFSIDLAARHPTSELLVCATDAREHAQFVVRVYVGKRFGHLQQNTREDLATDAMEPSKIGVPLTDAVEDPTLRETVRETLERAGHAWLTHEPMLLMICTKR